jgi:hypothetical protein
VKEDKDNGTMLREQKLIRLQAELKEDEMRDVSHHRLVPESLPELLKS